jgi:hypothetical protein
MKFNEDRVPATLDEAVALFIEGLSIEDVADITNPKTDAIHAHFTWGMMLRNEWELWNKENRIVMWFKENYGLDHADDISGLILDCVWKDVNVQPRNMAALIKKYYR